MNKLKALREKYGLTQKQLSDELDLDLSISQIRRLENTEKKYGNKITQRVEKSLDRLESDLQEKADAEAQKNLQKNLDSVVE